MLKAVTRSARAVDQRVAAINAERAQRGQANISVAYYFDHYGTEVDTQVAVVEEDFHRAREELTPSVSLDELRHYERVRAMFESSKEKDSGDGGGEERPASSAGVNGAATAAARQRATDAMKRLTGKNGPSSAPVVTNGAGAGGDQSRPTHRVADADAENDDFVIRTDRMSLQSSSPKKGKGKGKSREIESSGDAINGVSSQGGGNADAAAGKDLYD